MAEGAAGDDGRAIGPGPRPTTTAPPATCSPARGCPTSHSTQRRGEPVNLARRPGRAIVFVYPWTGRAGVANPPDWDDIPGAHGSTPETEGFPALTTSSAQSHRSLRPQRPGQHASSRVDRAPRGAVPVAQRCRSFFRARASPANLRNGRRHLSEAPDAVHPRRRDRSGDLPRASA